MLYGRQVSPWDYQEKLRQRVAGVSPGQPQGNRYQGGSSTTTGPGQPQQSNPLGLLNQGYRTADHFGLLGESKDQYINGVMKDINSSFVADPATIQAERNAMAGLYGPGYGESVPGAAPYGAGIDEGFVLGGNDGVSAGIAANPAPVVDGSLTTMYTPGVSGPLGGAAAGAATGAPTGLLAAPSGAAMAPGMAPLSMAPAAAAPAGVSAVGGAAATGGAEAAAAATATEALGLGALGPIGLGVGGVFALGSLLDWW